MGPSEKIGRSVANMVEGIKDTIGAKITDAVKSGAIKVESASLPVLIALVKSTVDAGYHQGARVLERDVAAAIATAGVPGAAAKKKSPSR